MKANLSTLSRAYVESWFEAMPKQQVDITERFISELNKLGFLLTPDKVIKTVVSVAEARDQAARLTIESAHPHKLGKLGQGQEIDMVSTPDLIGGLRVATGHTVIDASVSGSLNQISQIFRS
jgi:hypothetical protein